MSAEEIGLICALFLPAFLITWMGTVGLCKLLEFCFPTSQLDQGSSQIQEKSNHIVTSFDLTSIHTSSHQSHDLETGSKSAMSSDVNLSRCKEELCEATVSLNSIVSVVIELFNCLYIDLSTCLDSNSSPFRVARGYSSEEDDQLV